MTEPKNYVDAKHFTALFRQRHKNHNEIALIISEIAYRFCSRYYLDEKDADDIKQNCVLQALKKIPKFKVTKNGERQNAYSFFTAVISNHVLRQHRDRTLYITHMKRFKDEAMEAANFRPEVHHDE
jgi:DNA-directed RNA polymerase specialized sigma24 family protein